MFISDKFRNARLDVIPRDFNSKITGAVTSVAEIPKNLPHNRFIGLGVKGNCIYGLATARVAQTRQFHVHLQDAGSTGEKLRIIADKSGAVAANFAAKFVGSWAGRLRAAALLAATNLVSLISHQL